MSDPMHSSTVEWYVKWLQETHPDWTEDQRLEVATGFADRQQQPLPAVAELEEEAPADETRERSKTRHEARLHKFIGGLLKEAGE